MQVIIVNGHPRTGKNTFCKFAEKVYNTVMYSTVDTVKELATQMGWDGIKTDKNRAMLCALKDFTTEWFDMTYKEMVYTIEYEVESNKNYIGDRKNTTHFIFLYIREPKEIKRMQDWCTKNNINCYSVCITRSAVEGVEFSNHSDKDINEMIYDIYIGNNKTIDDFRLKSERFFDSIISGEIKEQLNWSP